MVIGLGEHLTFGREILNMKITDHIGIFENGISPELCQEIIDAFELWKENRQYVPPGCFRDGKDKFDKGVLGRDDLQIFLEVVDGNLSQKMMQSLITSVDEYFKLYGGIIQNSDPISSWTTQVQKTSAGGGYHVWHCENSSYFYRDRVVTWMVYLNTIPVENGGATEFLYQKLSLQPKVGTVVIWPAAYTHMHRGGFLTGEMDKYIATGWFNREPGQTKKDLL